MSRNQNLTRIKAVCNLLGPLNKDVVFVGGAVLSMYSEYSDPVTRPTEDVDIVIEIWSYAEYTLLDEKLRKLGFLNDRASGIICRYQIDGIIVDVLPTQGKRFGFFKAAGIRTAIKTQSIA